MMANNSENSQLYGPGGWLGALVFILAIASPIRTLLSTAANLNIDDTVETRIGPAWQTYEILSWILAAATIAGTLFLAWRLVYVRRRSTIVVAICGLWTLAILPILVDAAFSLFLFSTSAQAYLKEWIAIDLLRSAIFPTIWSAYLLRSRRVANTYTVDETAVKRIFG